jgi:gliding-associated putative ABC transporter substrate-binding component GldG
MKRLGEIFNRYYWVVVGLVGIIILNIAGTFFHAKLDLTEDKRFTLTEATKEIVRGVESPIFIQILLAGKFPAEFRRLPNSLRELLQQFKKINNEIQFRFEDPLEGEKELVKERLESWAKVGIVPTELNVRDVEGQTRQRIYPFAIFNYGDRQIAINLLEEASPVISGDLALNNSISLLEYKFANAIAKLQAEQKPNIVFSSGHGELPSSQTVALEGNLRAFYNTAHIDLDSIYQIPKEIDMLIVAKPTIRFSDRNLFVIDQYVMNGGAVIFLIDPLVVNLDSIRKHGQYLPSDIDHGLDDLFFKYGARVNRNFVLDLESSSIPMTTGRPGSSAQYSLFKWYYHVLAGGSGDHPAVKGLDRVNLLFPASIDTVGTRNHIQKTPLLVSSPYTRLQYNPVLLDFEILKSEPDPRQFKDEPQTMALLLEGRFTSLFENRVTPAMQQTLQEIGATYKSEGDAAKVMIVADGDVARNLVNANTGAVKPLGFNPYMNYTFDNQDFLTNTIEYMLDRVGLSQARAKTLKLRLLDQPRIQTERLYWQVLNVALPLILLIIFGFLFNAFRKYRFTKN